MSRSPSPFLKRLRAAIRVRHYSICTYVAWVHPFHGKRQPTGLGARKVGALLTHLPVHGRWSQHAKSGAQITGLPVSQGAAASPREVTGDSAHGAKPVGGGIERRRRERIGAPGHRIAHCPTRATRLRGVCVRDHWCGGSTLPPCKTPNIRISHCPWRGRLGVIVAKRWGDLKGGAMGWARLTPWVWQEGGPLARANPSGPGFALDPTYIMTSLWPD